MTDETTTTAHDPPVRAPRPIGTFVLAAILFLFGILFVAATIHRSIEDYSRGAAPLDLSDLRAKFHFAFVGFLAVAAAIGLVGRS